MLVCDLSNQVPESNLFPPYVCLDSFLEAFLRVHIYLYDRMRVWIPPHTLTNKITSEHNTEVWQHYVMFGTLVIDEALAG